VNVFSLPGKAGTKKGKLKHGWRSAAGWIRTDESENI
jgi:hypothetical protein